jgi:hypothetical protein
MVSLELLCLFPLVKARCLGQVSSSIHRRTFLNLLLLSPFCVRTLDPSTFRCSCDSFGLLQQSLVLDGIGTLHSWDQLRRGWYQTEQVNLDCLVGGLELPSAWILVSAFHNTQETTSVSSI